MALTDNLEWFYRCNETGATTNRDDSHTNSYDLTAVAMQDNNSSGNYDYNGPSIFPAAHFSDGAGSYLYYAGATSNHNFSADFTIAFWYIIGSPANTDNVYLITKHHAGSVQRGFYVTCSSANGLRLGLTTSVSVAETLSPATSTLFDGARSRHFCAISYNATNGDVIARIDGTKQTFAAALPTGGHASNTALFSINSLTGAGPAPTLQEDCSVSDIGGWSAILDDSHLDALYNNGYGIEFSQFGNEPGGGGGGDATLANQITIINHLTEIKGAAFVEGSHALDQSLSIASVLTAIGHAGVISAGHM